MNISRFTQRTLTTALVAIALGATLSLAATAPTVPVGMTNDEITQSSTLVDLPSNVRALMGQVFNATDFVTQTFNPAGFFDEIIDRYQSVQDWTAWKSIS